MVSSPGHLAAATTRAGRRLTVHAMLDPIVLPILVGLALLSAGAPSAAQTAPPALAGQPAAIVTAAPPATLVIWNRPIVTFRARVNQVDPASRASSSARRFEALPDDVRPEDIRAAPAEIGGLRGILVSAREHVLFGLIDEDLDPTAQESLGEVSQQAVAQLRTVLQARIEQRRPGVIARGTGLALGAAVLLVLILWVIRRTADRALLRLAEATGQRAVSILGVDVRRPLEALERGVVRVTAWALGFGAAYLWLTFSLYEFPYTRPWAERLRAELFDLLKDLAVGAIRAIPGIFAVVIIFLGARFLVRILHVVFEAVERETVKLPTLQPDTARATRQIATLLVWILALTVAYEYIPGSNTEAFKAVGVLLGVMLSLGSAGLVNQLMSGLVVVYSRALRPGEFVRAGDLGGRVSQVGLISTKLVSLGEEITIPNAVLVGSTVTNYSRLGGADGPVVSTAVGVGYDTPWRQVHAMLLLAAERTPGIRRQPAPVVLQRALSTFCVEYELRGHLETAAERARVLSELHGQVQDVFNEFGVQIMVPAFESQPASPIVVPRAGWSPPPAAPPSGDAPAKAAPPPKAAP